MNDFIKRHVNQISGSLSCLDRVIFKGYMPLHYPGAVERHMYERNILFKDFGKYVKKQSERIREHAEKTAQDSNRPFLYLQGYVRKESLVSKLIKKDNIDEGLVCVLRTLESCSSFKLAYGKGKPKFEPARRKCLTYYFYYIDKEFGLMYIRLSSWFPFMAQVYINGHEWLAKKLRKHGIKFSKVDNCFLWIEDFKRAQKFANSMLRKNWPTILDAFAKRVNPLLKDELKKHSYYWVADQLEFSTDISFEYWGRFRLLYRKLLRHAICFFNTDDVLRFLERKLHGNFEGEVMTSFKENSYRIEGARVKHKMKNNWVKMYDKAGKVLRVETVINQPREFKILKRVKRKGEFILSWEPMGKSVANIKRYAEVALRANENYLEALSHVEEPDQDAQRLRQLSKKKTKDGKSVKPFNPISINDQKLIKTVMRGDYKINGFRNKDVRQKLCAPTRDKTIQKKQSAQMTRQLKRLHNFGLIAKIPRSRRWRVTKKGNQLMSKFLFLSDIKIEKTILAVA